MGKKLSKYQMVQRYILTEIMEGRLVPGHKIPSEFELADQFQINRLTVRKALQLLVADGILTSAQGKGTFVSSQLGEQEIAEISLRFSSTSQKNIGVILPDVTVFFVDIYKAISQEAANNDYTVHIMINQDRESEIQAVNTMIEKKVDGVIYSPLRTNNELKADGLYRLLETGIPTVLIGKPPLCVKADCVMSDDVSGIYSAMKFLAACGHHTVVYLKDPYEDKEAVNHRTEGYQRGIYDFFPGSEELYIDINRQDWFSDFKELAEDKDKIAIFTDNNFIVYSVYSYLESKGMTACRDFDFVVFDKDSKMNQMNMKLHNIKLPKTTMGIQAFKMLDEKIFMTRFDDGFSLYKTIIPTFQQA